MASDFTLASASTENVQVPVQVYKAGQPYDPSLDTVQFAFITSGGQPVTGDYHAGSWTVNSQGIHLAQCLVGPANSGVVLAPGTYTVWVKITDTPEVPVRPAGTLAIT